MCVYLCVRAGVCMCVCVCVYVCMCVCMYVCMYACVCARTRAYDFDKNSALLAKQSTGMSTFEMRRYCNNVTEIRLTFSTTLNGIKRESSILPKTPIVR